MKSYFMLLSFLAQLFPAEAQKNEYDKYPVYNGHDLGVTYSKTKTVFKIWAPTADTIQLKVFDLIGIPTNVQMQKKSSGVWEGTAKGDLKNYLYDYAANFKGEWNAGITDPYARSFDPMRNLGLIIDLKETNPPGWQNDKSPIFKNPTDALIYELHVRDASIAPNSGIKNKGKFLGLIETGTKNADGLSTGLDHLKELGVTHIHLLPFFDFNSIDETKLDAKYNWGYDPLNYNVPEGSYSTNPYDGITRITEFKQLVKTFHENGLRVVMDVVYNHTALTETSNFNQLVPGYYYRQTKDGKFSNATACGNETASERPMMRKFMLESVLYWVKEYHIDGFRFDLMGVHDIETMNLISRELHKIKPDILLYGEGWTAGASPLPDSLRALKANVSKLDRIAVFSDDIRDGIKGSVFDHADKGFVSGKPDMEESVKFGIVAAGKHPQVDYNKVNYSRKPYAAEPYQTITYCECHDNHTLWDKLAISAKDATEKERIEMQKLSLSIVLTSQGISFLHAGTEFLRSKKGVENSFESPDSINAIDWSLKTKNKQVFEYVKALIRMRKEHPAFRMVSGKQIRQYIRFSNSDTAGIIAYAINGAAVGDKWKKAYIIFNGNAVAHKTTLPAGEWQLFLHNNQIAGTKLKMTHDLICKPYSCTILYK